MYILWRVSHPATSSFLLQDSEHLITLVHLTDYNVYRIPNAKRCFGAPFEWGACLRPNSNAEAEDTEAGETGLKVIAFDSEKSRACWLTAMRLAKVSDNCSCFRSRAGSLFRYGIDVGLQRHSNDVDRYSY